MPLFPTMYSEAWWDCGKYTSRTDCTTMFSYFLFFLPTVFISACEAKGWLVCFITHVAKMIVLVFSRSVSHDPGWDSRIQAMLCNCTFCLSHFWTWEELGGGGGQKKIIYFIYLGRSTSLCVLVLEVSVLLMGKHAFCLVAYCTTMRLVLSSFFIWALSLDVDHYDQMLNLFSVADSLLPSSSSEKNTFLYLFCPVPVKPGGLLPLALVRSRCRFVLLRTQVSRYLSALKCKEEEATNAAKFCQSLVLWPFVLCPLSCCT